MSTTPNNTYCLDDSRDYVNTDLNHGVPFKTKITIIPLDVDYVEEAYADMLKDHFGTTILDPSGEYYDSKTFETDKFSLTIFNDVKDRDFSMLGNKTRDKEDIRNLLLEKSCFYFEIEDLLNDAGLFHKDYQFTLAEDTVKYSWIDKKLMILANMDITDVTGLDTIKTKLQLELDFNDDADIYLLCYIIFATITAEPKMVYYDMFEDVVRVLGMQLVSDIKPTLVRKGASGDDTTVDISEVDTTNINYNHLMLLWLQTASKTIYTNTDGEDVVETVPALTLPQYATYLLKQQHCKIRFKDDAGAVKVDITLPHVPHETSHVTHKLLDNKNNPETNEPMTSTPVNSHEELMSMPPQHKLITVTKADKREVLTPVKNDQQRKQSSAMIDDVNKQPNNTGVSDISPESQKDDAWHETTWSDVDDVPENSSGCGDSSDNGDDDDVFERKTTKRYKVYPLFASIQEALEKYGAQWHYRTSRPDSLSRFNRIPLTPLQKSVRGTLASKMGISQQAITIAPNAVSVMIDDEKWKNIPMKIRDEFEDLGGQSRAKAPPTFHKGVFWSILSTIMDGNSIVHLQHIQMLCAATLGPLADTYFNCDRQSEWRGVRNLLRYDDDIKKGETIKEHVKRQTRKNSTLLPSLVADVDKVLSDPSKDTTTKKIGSLMSQNLGTKVLGDHKTWDSFVDSHLGQRHVLSPITQSICEMEDAVDAGMTENIVNSILSLETQTSLSPPSNIVNDLLGSVVLSNKNIVKVTDSVMSYVKPTLQSSIPEDIKKVDDRVSSLLSATNALKQRVDDISSKMQKESSRQKLACDELLSTTYVSRPQALSKLQVETIQKHDTNHDYSPKQNEVPTAPSDSNTSVVFDHGTLGELIIKYNALPRNIISSYNYIFDKQCTDKGKLEVIENGWDWQDIFRNHTELDKDEIAMFSSLVQ